MHGTRGERFTLSWSVGCLRKHGGNFFRLQLLQLNNYQA